jgi:hypothetical protein
MFGGYLAQTPNFAARNHREQARLPRFFRANDPLLSGFPAISLRCWPHTHRMLGPPYDPRDACTLRAGVRPCFPTLP